MAEHWSERALCREVDPELFYPSKGETVRPAKRVCMACEVRAQCLADALAAREKYGVRGGLTEKERRKLAKQQAQEPAQEAAA